MSYKGIKFNNKILDIPQEYLKSVDISNGVLTIVDSKDETYTFTIPEGVATEDFVRQQIANLVNSAPETLDTLGELATAFEENQDVVDALNSSITNKVDKVTVGSISYNSIGPVDGDGKDGLTIGSFDGTEPPVLDGSQEVKGSAITVQSFGADVAYSEFKDGSFTSSGMSAGEEQASFNYMKHNETPEEMNISQNGMTIQEGMLSQQMYKVYTNQTTGESVTNASNLTLSADEVSLSQQTTVGEETTGSSLSLRNGTAYLNDKELATKDDVSVDASNFVDLTSEQTITGTKTFNRSSSNVNMVLKGYSTLIETPDISLSGSGAIKIGKNIRNPNSGGVLIGEDIDCNSNTSGNGNVIIGKGIKTNMSDSVRSIGNVYLGYSTYSSTKHHGGKNIVIGYDAFCDGENIIQLGTGTNTTSKTLQVFDYQLLDADGKIPNERLNLKLDVATTDEIDALFT